MANNSLAVQERRRFHRGTLSPRVAVNLLQPHAIIPVQRVNVSEGGLCLQLQETLEMHSLVRLQLTSERSGAMRTPRSVECTGRVAWVVQRLDLRDNPPFLFDVGIEFVDPPSMLRQLIVQRSSALATSRRSEIPPHTSTSGRGVGVHRRALETCVIRGRHFLPRLERDPSTRITPPRRGELTHLVPSTALGARQDSAPRTEPVGLHTHHVSPWHLIVSVDGVPCFSHRYTSEAAAVSGWGQFKREQGKR